jgi:AraC-like DNA-binding protein
MAELRMKDVSRLRRRGMLDKEIATRLGFKHANHFSRALRERQADGVKPLRAQRMDM